MLKRIRLGRKLVGDFEPVFIVAEVANTHEGSFEVAKRMIDEIESTGVDAVKFQLHIPREEMIRSHPKFFMQGKRSLSIGQLADLKSYAETKGLYFLCTPFSRKAADQLEEIGVDAFKIGSGEMTDLPFIEHIARKGKPMIISTGMSGYQEITETVELVGSYGTPFMLVHCISIYPTPYERLNLGVIPKMRERYGVAVGLSDHTPEIFSAIAAVPYGVSLIEKHYTLNRNTVGTSDHKVSLERHEFKMLVDGVRKIEKARGNVKIIFSEERPIIEWARHAVVTVKDVPAGKIIGVEDISTKRPLYDGIPAKFLYKVIGQRAKHNITEDSIIRWTDIE